MNPIDQGGNFAAAESKRSPLRLVLFGCAVVLLLGGLCVGGLFTVLWKGKGQLDSALDKFEEPLLAGDYAGAYRASHPNMQETNTLQEFTDALKPVLDAAGPRLDRTTTSFNVHNTSGTGMTGEATYTVKHQNMSGTLRVSYREDAGELKVISWYVNF